MSIFRDALSRNPAQNWPHRHWGTHAIQRPRPVPEAPGLTGYP